ncbi:ECF RNA polymerase sigma factor SigK [Arthrobacter sp. H5]|uniref:ECF RNA polymerase sigma factor SigK n=1 Tax=Arthrobacter sp. H5 TaxID=1267973 RepID=UPI0004AF1C9C|nr:ECF RNA polymerase sigma factor SigK [Arthrobacter sp. H5]
MTTTQSRAAPGLRELSAAADTIPVDLAMLLHRVGQGDRSAFADFYGHTSSRVHGLVRRIVRDSDLSEDVTQEIYLQVWTGAGEYDHSLGTPWAWLMTLAHHRSVDKVRSEQRSAIRLHRYGVAHRAVAYDVVSETVADRWEAESVAGHLHSLTRIQRESLELAYYRGLTYQDAAAVMNVPLGTAKTRIRSALLRLRDCMGDQ